MAQLIDKAALVAEIEKHKVIWDEMDGNYCKGQRLAYSDMLSFLDTIEVKEVDLEKEVASYIQNNTRNGYFRADIHDVAEFFFELGLKATQKGE